MFKDKENIKYIEKYLQRFKKKKKKKEEKKIMRQEIKFLRALGKYCYLERL